MISLDGTPASMLSQLEDVFRGISPNPLRKDEDVCTPFGYEMRRNPLEARQRPLIVTTIRSILLQLRVAERRGSF
jgi:hypothetical protein